LIDYEAMRKSTASVAINRTSVFLAAGQPRTEVGTLSKDYFQHPSGWEPIPSSQLGTCPLSLPWDLNSEGKQTTIPS